MKCCACQAGSCDLVYHYPAPAITSLSTILDVDTRVYICDSCGHMQSADLPDVQKFYDTEYQISLTSEDADQLYDFVEGKPIYRTQYQADLILDFVGLPDSAAVLDYGAAKARSLYHLQERRPDILPHVFDVSEDYRSHWSWVSRGNQATYAAPEEWNRRFDLITAHFVLEHVREPVSVFKDISRLMAPTGRFFFTVPDVVGNPADMIVVDHLNHFTETSLQASLENAGMRMESIDATRLRGAYIIVAALKGESEQTRLPRESNVPAQLRKLKDCVASWHTAERLIAEAREKSAGKKAVIYGAGVYGTFVFSRIQASGGIACFLDRNPHVHGRDHLGLPVLSPDELPEDVNVVYVALNPTVARDAMKNLGFDRLENVNLVYLS